MGLGSKRQRHGANPLGARDEFQSSIVVVALFLVVAEKWVGQRWGNRVGDETSCVEGVAAVELRSISSRLWWKKD